jgi:D-arabinose 1-dehydrogenase-like Zn-dependent alcohol dehydrogenase
MLEFASYHNIKPVKMTFPLTLDGVKQSLTTLEEGRMRYRGVLVAP